jgi:hypothetical protein
MYSQKYLISHPKRYSKCRIETQQSRIKGDIRIVLGAARVWGPHLNTNIIEDCSRMSIVEDHQHCAKEQHYMKTTKQCQLL